MEAAYVANRRTGAYVFAYSVTDRRARMARACPGWSLLWVLRTARVCPFWQVLVVICRGTWVTCRTRVTDMHQEVRNGCRSLRWVICRARIVHSGHSRLGLKGLLRHAYLP